MRTLLIRLLYNVLFVCFFLIACPYYFMRLRRRGAWRNGFGQRFGFYETILQNQLQNRLQNQPVIWFHAVSVGEVNLCAMLMNALGDRLKGWQIVASTTTTTGIGELRKRLPNEVVKLYYPIDFLPSIHRVLRIMNPAIVVLIEAEIWPNLLWCLEDRGTPVFLVNARLSDRSAKWYARAHPLFSSLFSSFKGVGVQNESDAKTLQSLGCLPDRIFITGNLKFDAMSFSEAPLFSPKAILKWAGAGTEALVLLGSSTHSGEERMLAKIYLRLQKQFQNLFLILVPRHCERSAEVNEELSRMGIQCRLRSQFQNDLQNDFQNANADFQNDFQKRSGDCLLIDTTGDLRFFYEVADLVFIGKSMLACGGQNPIEAAAAGCAVLAGPHMQNFRAITRIFLEAEAMIQVQNVAELETEIENILLSNPKKSALGLRAKSVVKSNRGALAKTVAMMESHLKSKLNSHFTDHSEKKPGLDSISKLI